MQRTTVVVRWHAAPGPAFQPQGCWRPPGGLAYVACIGPIAGDDGRVAQGICGTRQYPPRARHGPQERRWARRRSGVRKGLIVLQASPCVQIHFAPLTLIHLVSHLVMRRTRPHALGTAPRATANQAIICHATQHRREEAVLLPRFVLCRAVRALMWRAFARQSPNNGGVAQGICGARRRPPRARHGPQERRLSMAKAGVREACATTSASSIAPRPVPFCASTAAAVLRLTHRLMRPAASRAQGCSPKGQPQRMGRA